MIRLPKHLIMLVDPGKEVGKFLAQKSAKTGEKRTKLYIYRVVDLMRF